MRAADVKRRVGGEPPLRFDCTLTFGLYNDPTTTFSYDYRTTLDGHGCFRAFVKPDSKQVNGDNTFDAVGAPAFLNGCVELPAD